MRASAHEICYVCSGRYPVIVCKPIVIAFALHARRPGCKPGASDAALVHAHDELPTRRAQPVPETSASARGRDARPRWIGCQHCPLHVDRGARPQEFPRPGAQIEAVRFNIEPSGEA